MNNIQRLDEIGQSVWLDYIRRSFVQGGELERLVEEGVRGLTSNPTIFQKAIAGSDEYDEALRELLGTDTFEDDAALFEALALDDIRGAADRLRRVYDASGGTDGFVSMEVAPDLAYDTEGTLTAARRLWSEIDRPNVMIKVPATKEGLPAIEQLIAEGVNVNVTLMFSLHDYEAVSHAYLQGLARCPHPERSASVASFFVSRVDTKVDAALDALGGDEAGQLRGHIAIANAKVAYQRYREIFHGEAFETLRARGAHPQRVLFASTSTKDDAYSDVKYVDGLVGAETVNTVPPDTLHRFLDHGTPAGTLEQALDEARHDLERLAALGIDLDEITDRLQHEGVDKFADSYTGLLEAIGEKRAALAASQLDRQRIDAGAAEAAVDQRLSDWEKSQFARRFWRKDPTLWGPPDTSEITNRMGWLHLPERMHDVVAELNDFVDEIRHDAFSHAVVLGMGGSSLAADVFRRTLGSANGYPRLHVLDSTHPDAIKALEHDIDPNHTLFLVSSKSGTTVEPLSFFRYFWANLTGAEQRARRFVAITDPGTPLETLARERGFRHVFSAPPDVGGRYSALSVFGLVPAALLGADIERLLDRAWAMSEASAFCVPPADDPALRLGAALGELGLAGRDKITFFASDGLDALPDWIEQLIAESTGKIGKGLLPVVDEPIDGTDRYGEDRVFVRLELGDGDGQDRDLDRMTDELARAGHPVIRFSLAERADIAQEMFRWEMAVPAAGAVIGIHPFNQPDVELAKKLAREAIVAKTTSDDIDAASADDAGALGDRLHAFLGDVGAGDYIAIQAFIAPSHSATSALQAVRSALRNRYRVATTLGFGPRFLHSTGQMHKGGPATGLFLQLVDEPGTSVAIPGTQETFERLIRAQADGDYRALTQRGRRVLRIALGHDTDSALHRLAEAAGA